MARQLTPEWQLGRIGALVKRGLLDSVLVSRTWSLGQLDQALVRGTEMSDLAMLAAWKSACNVVGPSAQMRHCERRK